MKIEFNFETQAVSIEGDGPDVVRLLELVQTIAPNLPKISINTAGTKKKAKGKGDSPSDDDESNLDSANRNGETLRQFCRKLRLDSNSEKLVAIGYYKKEREEITCFTLREMDQWFTFCGFKKPGQMSVAMFNARKRFGYVESAGHGKWQVTRNGDNLIIGKLNADSEE